MLKVVYRLTSVSRCINYVVARIAFVERAYPTLCFLQLLHYCLLAKPLGLYLVAFHRIGHLFKVCLLVIVTKPSRDADRSAFVVRNSIEASFSVKATNRQRGGERKYPLKDATLPQFSIQNASSVTPTFCRANDVLQNATIRLESRLNNQHLGESS